MRSSYPSWWRPDAGAFEEMKHAGGSIGTSYRHEKHGEEVDHGFHVETPLGCDADGGEEDQGADGGQKELGH